MHSIVVYHTQRCHTHLVVQGEGLIALGVGVATGAELALGRHVDPHLLVLLLLLPIMATLPLLLGR